MLILLLLACTGGPKDTGLGFDQPGIDDPTARTWNRAGSWYPLDPDELDAEIASLLGDVSAGAPARAAAVMTPHARLVSSGTIAAEVYARIEVPDTVLMLVPNHSNNGEALALWTEGPWLVPGHALEVDAELTEALQVALPNLVPDRVAFENHPAEMQLPFLQYLNPEAKVAVIAVRDTPSTHFPDFDVAGIEEFGAAISEVLAARDDVLLLSSSDLTHYESVETAEAEDTQLLSHINSLDTEGLYHYVTTDEITIGGEIVAAMMMSTLAQMGHEMTDFSVRGDSFHVKQDPEAVVGYGGVIAWESR